jgi:hypothetical protein
MRADAFIGKNIGGPWFPEPGNLWNDWEFRGDNRDFGGKFEDSRLRSWAVIDSRNIGKVHEGENIKADTDTGISYRRRTVIIWPGVRAWEIQRGKQTDITHLERVSDKNERLGDAIILKSYITLEAAAAYPFVAFSPEIDYKFVFEFRMVPWKPNDMYASVSFDHNQFPDYEALVNNKLIYKYATSDKGPGFWNLSLGSNVTGTTKVSKVEQEE